ncbi:MAG: Dam family site-specific DNA-(adenine-N6)-methyltransferase, partial [Rhodospirillaceae bacterium]|nr:Dam family site-specific DNA-(adenine-N6)-methyltransferase [Rhodospirillaceae bacterium]
MTAFVSAAPASISRPHASSLLRWAGSKRALLPRLSELAGANIDEYVEPFCGSAALFFSLEPKSAFLYDLNPNLIQALTAIKHCHDRVFEAFQALEGTKKEYYAIRDRYNHEKMSDIEAASTFIYLNRYGFNGLWRTNLDGYFNVPFGGASARPPGKEFFNRCAITLGRAQLDALDFRESLPRHRGSKVTVFADPPDSTSSRRIFQEYGPTVFPKSCFEALTSEWLA